MKKYLIFYLIAIASLPVCLSAQLCTTMEARAREHNSKKFDTIAYASIADNHLLWEVGQQILIRFFNGTSEQQSRVLSLAKEWEKYANIKFVQVYAEPSNVRVKFGTEEENYSLPGSDAIQINPAEQTLQLEFALFRDSIRLKRTVLHQFGHALGLMHEHSPPDAGIQWNKDTMYRHYAKLGWDSEMVDAQIFDLLNHHYSNSFGYDSKSIMRYPIPSWQTNNKFSVGWNNKISEGDKLLAGMIYPFTKSAANTTPEVKIFNYTHTLVKASRNTGGINCYPSFSMQTSGAISELFFTVTIYNKNGDPIMTSEEKNNVAGIVGTYKRLQIGPGKSFSVNKTNPEEFPLFIPFSFIPKTPENNEIMIVFCIYLGDGKSTKSIFFGNPVSFKMGAR
jgi:Astacin (Peptidase family M12A)